MNKYRVIEEPCLRGSRYVPEWKSWWWPFWAKFGAEPWTVDFMDKGDAIYFIEMNIELDKRERSIVREW